MPEINKRDDKEGRCPKCYLKIQDPNTQGVLDDGLVPVKVLEWDPKSMMRDPNRFRSSIVRDTKATSGYTILGSSTFNNAYSQMLALVKALPDGPHYMDTRDNQVDIHNGKQMGRPVFEYTYAGGTGELLEVTIRTKYTQSIEAARTSGIDPDTKEVRTDIEQNIVEEYDPCNPLWTRWRDPQETYDTKIDKLRMGKFTEMPSDTPKNQSPKTQFQQPNPAVLEHVSGEGIYSTGSMPAFNSEKDARSFLAANAALTKEEVERYDELLKKQYEDYAKKLSDWEEAVKRAQKGNGEIETTPPFAPNSYPDMIITRKVKFWVNPQDYDNHKTQAEAELNPSGGGYYNFAAHDEAGAWRRGFQALKSIEGFEVVYRSKKYKNGDRVLIEAELQIPIPGARTMSSVHFAELGHTMANELIESVASQIELQAKFVGNPRMESSQSTTIHNIGVTYSGDWYAKEVDHQFTAGSGYFTIVKYQKKSRSSILNKISTVESWNAAYKKMQGIAEKDYVAGDYAITPILEAFAEEIRKDMQERLGGGQVQIVQDKENPRNFNVFTSENDFSIGRSYSINEEGKILELK